MDDIFSWNTLAKGFVYQGDRITLVGPQGIWKPKSFRRIPISITTSPTTKYENKVTDDGFLIYKYRGIDLFHRDNVGLREAKNNQVPLIYFRGIVPGKYIAEWPVFIVDEFPTSHEFVVAVDAAVEKIYHCQCESAVAPKDIPGKSY